MTDTQPSGDHLEPTIEALSRYIINQTGFHWLNYNQPYFLANIPQDLKKLGVDYRKVIFPESLKHFVSRALQDHIDVITHPIQKAKIVLVPKGANFKFEEDISYPLVGQREMLTFNNSSLSSIIARSSDNARKDVLINFLKALQDLPEAEINDVKIPTSILIKFLA